MSKERSILKNILKSGEIPDKDMLEYIKEKPWRDITSAFVATNGTDLEPVYRYMLKEFPAEARHYLNLILDITRDTDAEEFEEKHG